MRSNDKPFNVVSALRLRGMRVLSQKNNVIHIARPSGDFARQAVEIIENSKGIRSRCMALQFHGVTVRWNEER